MTPAQIAEKLNKLETAIKAHAETLNHLEHAISHQEHAAALNSSNSGTKSKFRLLIGTLQRWISWSPNFSLADAIQILILIIIILTLRQAQHAERRQVRAWVGSGVYNSWIHVPERDTNNLVKWHISIKNYGSSPALEVNYHTRLLPLDRDARSDSQKQQEWLRLQAESLQPMAPIDGTTIFPGEIVPNEGFSGSSFSPEQLERFKSGSLWFVVIGKIFYKDIFGDAHTTQFCRIAYPPTVETPEGGIGACLVADKAD